MTLLLVTDVFNPLTLAESTVLTARRLTLDAAEQFVNSCLYGLPDERRQVVGRVESGTVCDALNSCRSFGVPFSPRAPEFSPSLHGGDAVLFVTLDAPYGKHDPYKGISPTYIAAHASPGSRMSNYVARLINEARDALAFVLLEVECEVEGVEPRPASADEVVSESTYESPH